MGLENIVCENQKVEYQEHYYMLKDEKILSTRTKEKYMRKDELQR
jgi:hypothetical protein